jgi:hypothetical protein
MPADDRGHAAPDPSWKAYGRDRRSWRCRHRTWQAMSTAAKALVDKIVLRTIEVII